MNNQLKTFIIPDDLCRKAGLAATWLPIDQISVFPYEKKHIYQKDGPSHFANHALPILFHLRQSAVLFHPILRKFVNESNGVFLSLQNIINKKVIEQKLELVKLSRQYRSIIRACLENFQEELSKLKRKESEELENYVTIFYSVECIWHLCEILFIDVSDDIVLPRLLDWVGFYFPKYERNAAALIGGDVIGLESHPKFWETVLGLLLQGRMNIVRALLRQHSASDSSTFKLVDQVLRTMPTYDVADGTPVNEFVQQRRQWIIDVQSKIDANFFVSEINLNLIMKLVIGEKEAWEEIQNNCETWYEYLAGWLFFTEPTVKSFELGQFAKRCITKTEMKNNLRHLDRAVLAIMEFDLFQVIQEVQCMADNGWFVSHLTDLLYHSGGFSSLEKDVNNLAALRKWGQRQPLAERQNIENPVRNEEENEQEVVDAEYPELEKEAELRDEQIALAMEGRRIINISYFWEQIKNIQHMPFFSCNMDNCNIVKEKRNEFLSTFTVKCNMCGATSLLESDRCEKQMDINMTSVLGTTSTGCGYSQLEQLTSLLNIPSISQKNYLKNHSDLEKIIQDVLMQELKLAGEEEAKLNGHIDKDGTPCITVIADGAWSKRSYKTNYNALSGVAVIIGEATKKVLFLGVKNKFCMFCTKHESKNEAVPDHSCAKNWSGSSTSMESAIIIEGFKTSMEIHGLKYTKLVGNGDSSVTKKLLIKKPYGATLVEKVECVNHLLRNLCHKLKDISKIARSSSSLKIIPMKLRKKLENSILKFRVAIKKAAEYRGKSNLTYSEKLLSFQKDVHNSVDHIFGCHEKCDEYFCTGVKAGEEDLIPEMIECGLKQDIINCLQRVVTNSSSFLLNKNNNAAELFNSLVNQYVGGKRVNFSFKASYQTRCQLAAIAYNSKERFIEKIMEFVRLPPGLYTRRFIIKRQLRRERSLEQKKKRGFRRKITISHADEDYGAVEQISDEEMKSRKEKLESILRKTPEEIVQIEQETRGQSSNPLWHQERAFRITASNFGRICKLKATTKPDATVKNLLYNKFTGNSATKYGQEHEIIAIQDFEELTGLTIIDCGLFIGHDAEYFLGASPDGLVADDNSIIEVKCPETLKKISIQQGMPKKKLIS